MLNWIYRWTELQKREGIQFQRTEIDGYGKWLVSVCDFPTFCTFLWQMIWYDGKTQWCFVSKKFWPWWILVIEKIFAALFESVYLGALHLCWFLAVVYWLMNHLIYLKLRKSKLTKGQLISKANCQAEDSSKKRTKEFVFTSMRRVCVRFL